MLKKVLLGALVLVVVLAGGLYFWARSILATDTVRTAIARSEERRVGKECRL